MKHLFFPILLALIGGPAFAADPHPQLAAGLEAYEFFCSKCHGKDMINSGVSSYDLRKFPLDQKERFYSSVRDGSGAMPAWGDVIYPDELDALWVYVATRGGTQPLPEEDHSSLTPDPDAFVTQGKLTACLSRNAGAVSGLRADGGTGFDYVLSKALAQSLELELDVVWFENEAGEESDPVHETYAMLAYGLCDIVPSHPLYARSVGPAPTKTAALPLWLGMPEEVDAETRRRMPALMPHVALAPIDVTVPYMRAEIGLVYPANTAEPRGPSDLAGRTLAYQQGTLSGALVEMQQSAFNTQTRAFNPGPRFLWHLETGTADVALVDVAAFDAHRKHNKVTTLKLADWRHSVGLDIGIAVLAQRAGLKAALDRALSGFHQAQILPDMAAAEGLTYNVPKFQGLQAPFTLRSLQASN